LEIEIRTNVLNDLFGLSNRIEIEGRDSIVLWELLHRWETEHGRRVLERVLDGPRLREEVVFLVNDQNVGALNGLDTVIRDGDRLVILSAVTGG
jgi:molybdopterin converting factor small subunit